jgi:hypothetical protein
MKCFAGLFVATVLVALTGCDDSKKVETPSNPAPPPAGGPSGGNPGKGGGTSGPPGLPTPPPVSP